MTEYEKSKISDFYGKAISDIWDYLLRLSEQKNSRSGNSDSPRTAKRRITHTYYNRPPRACQEKEIDGDEASGK